MADAATGHGGEARSLELRELATALSSMTRRVDSEAGQPLDKLVGATCAAIPGARTVSLTVLEGGRFETKAWTDEPARRADALQYEVGRGPCIDAVLENTAYTSADVAVDPRWGEWGPRVAREVGVHSVLAHRLALEGPQEAIASLNVYSDQVNAFDEGSLHLGVVLATHGSLLMSAIMARDAAADLAESLQANREVGVAMGVLMHRHRLTRDQAFDLLRLASQQNGIPLAQVALSVTESGDLTLLEPRLGRRVAPEGAGP